MADEPDTTATEGEPEPEVSELPTELVTTTMTKDYLNRALTNLVPGTSNATDYLGRAVVTGDKDYMGRALVA